MEKPSATDAKVQPADTDAKAPAATYPGYPDHDVYTTPLLDSRAGPSTEFSTEMCQCGKGTQACETCLLAFFLPCVAHGMISDKSSNMGQTTPCALYSVILLAQALIGAPALGTGVLGTLTRTKFRKKYGLKGSTCNDFVRHLFCHPCSMAQELRHIISMDEGNASVATRTPPPGGLAGHVFVSTNSAGADDAADGYHIPKLSGIAESISGMYL